MALKQKSQIYTLKNKFLIDFTEIKLCYFQEKKPSSKAIFSFMSKWKNLYFLRLIFILGQKKTLIIIQLNDIKIITLKIAANSNYISIRILLNNLSLYEYDTQSLKELTFLEKILVFKAQMRGACKYQNRN